MVDVIYTGRGLLKQIPLIGGDLSQIGQALDYTVYCRPASADLWVYGFFHAVPTLVVSLIKPEIRDINIGHKGRKPRKGKLLSFFVNALLEGTYKNDLVPNWKVFQFGELAQRIGWYMLVLDATSDFAINWTSMVYQWNGCDLVPQSPSFLMERDNVAAISSGAAGWRTYISGSFVEGYQAGLAPTPGRVQISEACAPFFSLDFDPKPWPGNPETQVTGYRIRSFNPDLLVDEWRPDDPRSDGGGTSHAIPPLRFVPAGTEFSVEYYMTDGAVGLNHFRWSMTSTDHQPSAPLAPDP